MVEFEECVVVRHRKVLGFRLWENMKLSKEMPEAEKFHTRKMRARAVLDFCDLKLLLINRLTIFALQSDVY